MKPSELFSAPQVATLQQHPGIEMSELNQLLLAYREGRLTKAQVTAAIRTLQQPDNCSARFASQWVVEPAEMVPSRSAQELRTYRIYCERLDSVRQLCQSDSLTDKVFCAEHQDIWARFERLSQQLLALLGTLFHEAEKPTLIQVVVSRDDAHAAHFALAAMLRVAHIERPDVYWQIIALPANLELDAVKKILAYESVTRVNRCVDYHHASARFVLQWNEIPYSPLSSIAIQAVWKNAGTYVISGGAGALAELFAREIAAKTHAAHIVLIGRSPATQKVSHLLSALSLAGAHGQYLQADISSFQETQALIARIRRETGRIDGVIHAAGLLRDGYLRDKTAADLDAVVLPKLNGWLNLDEATRDDALDIFIGFSSIASVLGNAGQADYALANAAMERAAFTRYESVGRGFRRGRTLCISWPLWSAGGMKIDAHIQTVIENEFGLKPMSSAAGLENFYQCLQHQAAHITVVSGLLSCLREQLSQSGAQIVLASPETALMSVAQPAVPELLAAVTRALKMMMAELTKHPAASLDAHEPFERFGFDSIMVTRLNQRLAEVFGPLSRTLAYEFKTIDALAQYLSAHHSQACTNWTNSSPVTAFPSTIVADHVNPVTQASIVQSHLPVSKDTNEAIAIIGLSGQYPDADTLQEFWKNLKAGRDSISEIPADRWSIDNFFEADRARAVASGKSYSKWGGFVQNFANFDPLFFNIAPKEALAMDPQERLFIQSSWEVLEDACITKEQLNSQYGGRVGVFAGITKTSYAQLGTRVTREGEQISPRISFSSVPNRVSYLLNLNGPSMPIDTMCSSSLTAIHEACEHLLRHDCDLAIAGGVNLYLHPSSYTELSAAGMLSDDGRCRSFGLGGNGFVPGEGVGCVLLKRLSEALADHDNIRAVIRATHVNHGGKTNGYSVPNPVAQRELIQTCLRKAGIEPAAISYVEAHGTGTELGDPIEFDALAQALQAAHPTSAQPCAIGSVKSNIGHLEAAAGIAGLTKVVFQMEHGQLVPSLHASRLNPNIDIEHTSLHIQQQLSDWVVPTQGISTPVRLATVSSFGAGGANAHLVIQEHIQKKTAKPALGPVAIVLSARDNERLMDMVVRLAGFIDAQEWNPTPGVSLTNASALHNLAQHVATKNLAAMLHVSPDEFDMSVPLSDYGVSAYHMHALAQALREEVDSSIVLSEMDPSYSLEMLLERFIQTDRPAADTDLAQHDFLVRMAYSLQTGREEMVERLGCMVHSLSELRQVLKSILDSNSPQHNVVRASVRLSGEAKQSQQQDQQLQHQLSQYLTEKNLTGLLKHWVQGVIVDWRKLYMGEIPQRLSLPTYPFSGKRFWLGDFPPVIATTAVVLPTPSAEIAPITPPQTKSVESSVTTTSRIRAKVQESIRNSLKSSLGLEDDEIQNAMPFSDYGLDSILGVQLVRTLNEQLGIALDTTVIFDHSSVVRLTGHICSTYAAQLDKHISTLVPPTVQADPNRNPIESVLRAAERPSTFVQPTNEPIAIIGVSGKFPQSDDSEALWSHLLQGHDLVTDVTRWPLPDTSSAPQACRKGGFLDGIDQFDSLFFNISGLEASYMDPQQRLFLEQAWKALEYAGYVGEAIEGSRCGVYVGCSNGDYQELFSGQPSSQSLWGNMASVIAARIAYFLDLKGPALSIDTSCSSSLVAITMACKDLWSGDADIALAGGVFVQTTAKLYTSANRAGMLSPTGFCRAFDASADGFVPSEGVGAVVLKRLSDAVRDGDCILGVIAGAGLNQDGATNGITAPSAKSQEALLREVYTKFSINPDEMDLIEAHGTGTRLGDPIEFAALTRAFRADTQRLGFCALGSVKTNIGHSQFAAGIAGVMKVLLALKHEIIPPSLHFESANPEIDFETSPFFVNTQARAWKAGTNRLAGVSAFGASGTNAHVVIGEAPAQQARKTASQPGYLMVLSARTPEQLKTYAKIMAEFCQQQSDSVAADISFTLLAGRKHFEHRLACVVHNQFEFASVLMQWAEQGTANKLYIGHAAQGNDPDPDQSFANNQSVITQLSETLDPHAYLALIAELAKRYVSGTGPVLSQVKQLFNTDQCFRIPLPGYPFVRARHWVRDAVAPSPATGIISRPTQVYTKTSHPLLHGCSQQGERIVYSTVLSRHDFFIADHRVHDQYVLPGVIILEMAHAAYGLSIEKNNLELELSDVVWIQPCTIDAEQIKLALRLESQNGVTHFSLCDDEIGRTKVYAQGVIKALSHPRPAIMHLVALQKMCAQGVWSAAQCKAAIEAMRISHGPSMQCIDQVLVGQGIALAQLSLSESVNRQASEWVLHPGILDSAIQASIALFAIPASDGRFAGESLPSAVPFALDRMRIFAPCTHRMWAVLRNTTSEGDATQSLNIDLCDDIGRVCVQLQGYRSRLLPAKADNSPDESLQSSMTILVTPHWVPTDVSTGDFPLGRVVIAGCHVASMSLTGLSEATPFVVSTQEDEESIANRLRNIGPIAHLVWMADRRLLDRDLSQECAADSQHNELVACFKLLKALLLLGQDAQDLCWTLVTFQTQAVTTSCSVHAAHAGLHGLFGSLAKEYLNWDVRLLDLDVSESLGLKQLLGCSDAHSRDVRGVTLAHRAGQWYRAEYRPVTDQSANDSRAYRSHGVYIVVGGAGGVGQVWTESITRTHQAQVIWIGRRPIDHEIQQACDKIGLVGPAPRYYSVDATDIQAMQELRQQIRQEFGEIHGVIHSAIVLADRSLARMDDIRMLSALAAKIDISHVLMQVFGNDALDFVLFFSSVQSFSRMPGQSNYAAASTYMDAFAAMAGEQLGIPVKVMNWGYWGNVGIVATPEYRARMRLAGWESLEPEKAMQGLKTLITHSHSQLALIHITAPSAMQGLNLQGVRDDQALHTPRTHMMYDDSVLLSPPAKRVDEIRKVVGNQMSDMDPILSRLLLVQLNAAGILTQPHALRTDVMQMLPPLYHRWMDQTFTALEQAGLLELTTERYRLVAPQSAQQIWSQWEIEKALWVSEPNRSAQITLVETMLRALPDILMSKRLATDAMFPESSLALVEGIYKNNMVADYFNEVLGDCLLAHIQDRLSRDPSSRLRIIEVGAGTGGTTAKILPRLKSVAHCIEQYCYTDLSRAFLMHAKREYFPGHPFLTCELFDAEKPVSGQKIAAGTFDIAIATNVLHATRNIQNTLSNVRDTLKPEGLLFLNELSDNVLFSHLTFGLLEGWWRYDDQDCRIPGSPGLYPQQWKQALERAQFPHVHFPATVAHPLGQQVIVAQQVSVTSWPEQRTVATRVTSAASVQVEQPIQIHNDQIRDKAIVYLKRLVAETIQIPSDQIETSTPFERYGIDSILVVQITANLRKVFTDVSSTLLFDVQTISGLVDYFLEQQSEKLAELVGVRAVIRPAVPTLPALPISESAPVSPQKPTAYSASATAPAYAPAPSQPINHDIAIIGLSGRYPGANDVNTFWENLSQGKNGISEIPGERWDWRQHFDSQKGRAGKSYTQWGGFLDNIASFDPLFFHLSPAEAEKMDPQERLFLQESYAAIQDAGYAPASLGQQGRVGVFAGVMNARYPSGAAFWSVANRVSYLLNFTGPSLAVDTACSSSLTAIHLAVESLQSGMSDCALAGGVNLIVDPAHLATLSEMMMLSAGNISRSFGSGADGFIDGEAVGVVVLKRLDQAVSDGDHIYGVIRGTAINAGGKTSSYTVPSPSAQSRVIDIACQRAGIHPRSISYIEAHGTGTALGDPIEVAGLTKAYTQFTSERQFCAIGSVKSNIGHSESAAGIAGLTKVLMQLKHKQLAPTLNVETVNPEIDFTQTPFYLQETLSDWQRPQLNINGKVEQHPRRAGISSFGAGGANAHLIIEEFDSPISKRNHSYSPQIFLYSAKQPDRLLVVIARMLNYLQANTAVMTPDLFEDVAFTLQIGREHHAQRLAIVANDPANLIEKLQAVLEQQKDIADVFSGVVGTQSELLRTAGMDEDMQQTLVAWANKGKLTKLLPWWVAGLQMDWQSLYPARQARRISLPTYPFAEEKYWMARDVRQADIERNDFSNKRSGDVVQRLHPLMHRNISTFNAYQFETSFDGSEFFLRDHVVQGAKMLPGVAYLEWAHAAIRACALSLTPADYLQISNIAWMRPMTVSQDGVKATIKLTPNAQERVDFEIFSAPNASSQAPVSHCRGFARRVKRSAVASRDIVSLTQNPAAASISSQDIYRIFSQMGIEYGPAHQAVQSLLATPDCVVARLELLPSLCAELATYVLHPALMDAALQSSIGLMVTPEGELSVPPAAIPFAVESVDVLGNCLPTMWAVVTRTADQTRNASIEKIDIDLCDDSGKICVAIKGFSTRRIKQDPGANVASVASPQPRTAAVAAEVAHHAPASSSVLVDDDMLDECAIEYFTQALSRATKLDASRITPNMLMEEVGLDSIMVIKMTADLEEAFGVLSKTIFFENRTIREVVDYFMEVHRETLAHLLINPSQPIAPADLAPPSIVPANLSAALPRDVPGVLGASTSSSLPTEHGQPADIAIIGLAGRYPQAATLEEFWRNLSEGRDSISMIPADRWDHSKYFDSKPGTPNKTYGDVGGFLDKVTQFDSLFFNISPRDAQAMDPQERIFMECAYHALQDAGYSRAMLGASSGRSVGVFVGAMGADYQLYGPPQTPDEQPAVLSASHASIANRVSFFLDLNGPSLSIDTMCSSGLTAIHMGCQAIATGDCDLVIAGAVNLSLHPLKYLGLAKGKYLSQRGRCSSFGIDGDGYVPGEGVGAVLLKPLAQALADGDVIHGVIKATAINHGGRANGYTVPSPQAQSQLVVRALNKAGITARQLSYFEAHGTGTPLGDPIEIAGLTKAFSHSTLERNFCAIGSVKSNIGHCEAAAGMAALTKVLLQMKHRKLVPSLHAEVLNPNIAFAESPFFVQRTLSDWQVPPDFSNAEQTDGIRYAGISSFGAGGANANLIIQEPPALHPVSQLTEPSRPQAIVLSARTPAQLDAMVQDLRDSLLEQPARLVDIAFTLQTGRDVMQERFGVVVSSKSELIEQLNLYLTSATQTSRVLRSHVRANKKSADERAQPSAPVGATAEQQLALWMAGHPVDWHTNYVDQPVWRVSLPGYRFAEQSFWVPDRDHNITHVAESAKRNVAAPTAHTPAADLLLLRPAWVMEKSAHLVSARAPVRREIVLIGMSEIFANEMKERAGTSIGLHLIATPAGQSTEIYIHCASRLFEFFRALIQEKLRSDVLVQVVVHAAHQAQFQGLAGLLRTVRLENQHIKAQLVSVQPVMPVQETLHYLDQETTQASTSSIRYLQRQRQVWHLSELVRPAAGVAAPWKAQAVYLITGGNGALGQIFARDIARSTTAAIVLLVGRKPITSEVAKTLEVLRQHGASGNYIQADISQEPDVIGLMQTIRQTYGRLDGILHAAGHLHDDYILNKQTVHFREVLQPKVSGTAWLDQYSHEQEFQLDMFVMFSSIASVSGNPGQSDYAAANGFMDQYAEFRDGLRASGLRTGVTVSLNWPLWQAGGMRPDETSEQLAFKKFGLGALDEQAGLQAFYEAMTLGCSQIAVLTGVRSKLLQTFDIKVLPADGIQTAAVRHAAVQNAAVNNVSTRSVLAEPVVTSAQDSSKASTLEKFGAMIRETAAHTAKIKIEEIEMDVELSDYGFDSVMFTELANALNENCSLDLTPVLFFEYPTINALSQYLHDLQPVTEVTPLERLPQATQVTQAAQTPAEDSMMSVVPAKAEPLQSLDSLITQLVSHAANLINVDVSLFDAHVDLSEFGYDSIAYAGLADALNEAFSLDLSPAVFFEYTSIEALAQYLHETAVVIVSDISEPVGLVTQEVIQEVTQKFTQEAPQEPAKDTAPIAPDSEPIAIVGISGSFPGGADVDTFWDNLLQGKDCITEIPPSRWDWKELYGDPHAQPGTSDIKWGGFIEDADQFDPRFFDISPSDAQTMDPQQRLLMLYVWRAIEDAGYAPHSLSGSDTGLFVATSASGYGHLLKFSSRGSDRFTSTSMVGSVGPNRMSYFLNLHGPSEPIETACSSALVALDRGVNALRYGGCDTVIVGAVNTMVTPDLHIGLNRAGMLSPDGHCKTFSADANGYVRSEAVVMLVMKRLSDAQRSGDHIYGLVRGSAVNHGGRANTLTAPNPMAQTAVIKRAFRVAGIDPRTVGMIEAHGTGTKLGDPIEISALKTAFAEMVAQSSDHSPLPKAYCALGAVKSHIGHAELAAGLTGVVKVLMQFKHRMLIKNLNSQQVNPYLNLSDSPFYLPEQNRPWQALQDANGQMLPRRAGVSSFGFGGVNAHVLLEEYVEPAPSIQTLSALQTPQAIVLSAKSQTALRQMANNLVEYVIRRDVIRQNEAVYLQDLAYTLQVGRDAMSERLAVVVSSCDELIDKVQAFIDGDTKVARIFFGAGRPAQHVRTLRDAVSKTMSNAAIEAINQGAISTLASLWAQGEAIDWKALKRDRQPRRLRLPTYAFDLKRYWFDMTTQAGADACEIMRENTQAPTATQAVRLDISETSPIAIQVMRVIADHAGVGIEEIRPDMLLIDLGVDSVSLMQLASNLIKACGSQQPAVQANALLQCSQVQGLIQCFSMPLAEQQQVDPLDAKTDRAAELLSFVKKYESSRAPENLICSAVALNDSDSEALVGKVVVDTTHAFFFDHPLDHVSGMHLGAAMQQLAELNRAWSQASLPEQGSFYTAQLALNFRDLCQLSPQPVMHVKHQFHQADQTYEVIAEQQGRTVAEGIFVMRSLNAQQVAGNTLSNTAADLKQSPPHHQPVAASRVNKHNPVNVLLGDPVGTQDLTQTSGFGAWLVDRTRHSFFNETPGRPINIFVFAEAARQLLRLFGPDQQAHPVQNQHLAAPQDGARVELLNKIEVSLLRPLYWTEPIYLDLQIRNILQVGDATRLRYEGQLMVDGVSAGQFACEAMSLSAELQRQWASQTRDVLTVGTR
jgi:polyketide synthase PksN